MHSWKKKKTLVLCSGGLDSVANLIASRRVDEPILAVTFDYGQRANAQEIRAARFFADRFNVPHQVIELPFLKSLGASALTQRGRTLPQFGSERELDDPSKTEDSARSVWVPNRNGVFIQIAAAFAEGMGLQAVVVGFNREEAATFPDNSIEFLEATNEGLHFSTRAQVEVVCYTHAMVKKQIVKQLLEWDPKFPFAKLWSCYEGFQEACGVCESCLRLSRALNATVGTGSFEEKGSHPPSPQQLH